MATPTVTKFEGEPTMTIGDLTRLNNGLRFFAGYAGKKWRLQRSGFFSGSRQAAKHRQ